MSLKHELYTYRCDIGAEIDGDTLKDVVIDLGCHVVHRPEHIRLLGVNAPELHAKDRATRERALQAKQFVDDWLDTHIHHVEEGDSPISEFPFLVHTVKTDSFGRYLGRVECRRGHSLNADLLASGLADPFMTSAEDDLGQVTPPADLPPAP
jgi:endonuclease YncB( thermonuclease family)